MNQSKTGKFRILAFDLSRHTGWAVLDDEKYIASGYFDVKIVDWKNDVYKTEHFPEIFPANFAAAVKEVVDGCEKLVEQWTPDLVVTEFIEGSGRRFSQMFLDWLHFEFYVRMSQRGQKYKYILNSDWRNHVGCWISQHPDIKKYNAKVGQARRKTPRTKTGARVAKINGRVVSRIDKKKLSILLVSKHFNITIKSDDEADALNQARAAQAIWGKLIDPVRN